MWLILHVPGGSPVSPWSVGEMESLTRVLTEIGKQLASCPHGTYLFEVTIGASDSHMPDETTRWKLAGQPSTNS